jgi:predicted Ser/Thr protein kinase
MELEFLNKIIFGKFQIMKLIGKGAYSRIFSVKNLANNNIFAMKVQDKSEFYGNLENEAYILYQLKGLGIPKIISYGRYRKYKVLVMELLGKSIDQMFIENVNIEEKLKKKMLF